MKKDIKKRWVEALRSGEFHQGTGGLHLKNEDGVDQYCCLGVLCELAHRDGVVDMRLKSGDYYQYGREDDWDGGHLPRPVFEWAGLDSSSPRVHVPRGGERHLAGLNDSGISFERISHFIEEDGEL